MRILSMRQIREVLRLYLTMQLSSRKIQATTGVGKTTVQEYIKRCDEAELNLLMFNSIDDDTLHLKLFGESKSVTRSSKKVYPDYTYIHQELKNSKKTKVTLMLLWQEYKEHYKEAAYEYTQFRVHYRTYKQKLNPSMRQVHLAGEKVFVDYSGVTIPIHNQKTGEVHKAQLFIAVLGASGATFAHVTLSQKQEDFILSHVLAYEYFGGTPNIVVPDNLKSAIISNNKNGIVVNESYLALARHYSMQVLPARPRKPKDKPLAEQGVQAIQRFIVARFRHQKFYSVYEVNEAIKPLLDTYNSKVMKHLNKSRFELLETIDKPMLNPLPANRYIYEQFKVAKVNQDYHISLLKCNYSVPFNYLKQEVEVRYSTHSVQIYHKNVRIATHPRLHRIGESSTLHEHMPKEHQYINEKMNPDRLRSWAKSIGDYCGVFVEDAFTQVECKPNAYRHIIAVLSLAKIYGRTELELALIYAIEHRTIRTKSIKSILDKKLYLQKSANNIQHQSSNTPALFNTHSNLRDPQNYK